MFIKRANQSHLRNKRQNTEIAPDSSSTLNSLTNQSKLTTSTSNFTTNSQETTTKEEGKKEEDEDQNLYSDDNLDKKIKSLKRAFVQTSKRNQVVVSNDDKNTIRNESLVTYEGDRTINTTNDQMATKTSLVDAHTIDHRSILERDEEIGRKILSGELEEGVYRGLGAYRPILNRRDGAIAAGKYTGNYGPVRGTDNVRMTMRIDLNPEICKDYKETGYCGYGDTCKFIHDRSDYKSGWQLEKEWNELQKQKQLQLQKSMEKTEKGSDIDSDEGVSEDDFDSDDENIPFACLICKKKWTEGMEPVVTCCNHYFCEECAFKHYAKTSKCFVCKRQTQGIFNSAEIIIQKTLNKKNRGVKI